LFDPEAKQGKLSPMDADERDIYYFLKSWRHEYVSSREICRRAGGKRRFRNEPEWAKSPLARMVERGIVEADPAGHYRLKPPPKGWDKRRRRWASPHIAQILKNSGRDFSDSIIEVEDKDLDEYYDSL
jgi:hypothetical protein